jgi:hypothetical protein
VQLHWKCWILVTVILDISYSNFGYFGAIELEDMFKTNKSIKTIYLRHNNIGDDVAIALREIAKKNKIKLILC